MSILPPRRMLRAGARQLLAYRPGMVDYAAFSRASAGSQLSAGNLVQTAASGALRDAHHVTHPTAAGSLERSTLLEARRLQYAVAPEDFTDAAWQKSGVTVTANAATGGTGTVAADRLTSTAGADNFILQTAAYGAAVGGKTFTVSFWARLSGGGSFALPVLLDDAAGNTAIDPRLASGKVTITGTSLRRYSVSGTFAAGATGTNLRFGFGGHTTWNVASAPDVWGFNLHEGGAAASYQAATLPDRAEDFLSFAFAAPPQPLTVYLRLVEMGSVLATTTSARLFEIGSGVAARLVVYQTGGTYRAYYQPVAGQESVSTLTAAPVVGDLVEIVATLSATGQIQIVQSINRADPGTGGTGTVGTALGLPAAWSAATAWLGRSPSGNAAGLAAFTHAYVWPAVQDLSTSRQRAGTG